MTIALLLIIYLVFISLGLPDSLIGTTWPAISNSLNIPESYQGFLTCSVSLCTILSSLSTPFLVKKIKTSGTVCVSIVLTVTGLVTMSFVPNFWLMILTAIPLGLGAGAIDTVLNNYIALHYKALHMNWLHSFWGVGATVSPLIVSYFLMDKTGTTDPNGWRTGALVLACIQASIFIISLLSLPLWKRCGVIFVEREKNNDIKEEETSSDVSYKEIFKIKGIYSALIAFLAYIAVESLTGMWFSSMVYYGITDSAGNSIVTEKDAAQWGAMFYLGITAGRFISGLLSLKFKEKTMLRIGETIIVIGSILLFMTFEVKLMPVAVVLIGLGCAPIYPAMLKDTPNRFGTNVSQNIMSFQMAGAYISNLVIAPAFGILARYTTFLLLPYFVIAFLVLLILGNEAVYIAIKRKQKVSN